MSAILNGPETVGDPPRWDRLRTLLSVAVALLIAFGGLFAATAPAQAGTFGMGYDIGQGFLGAYRTDDGRQAYCIDLGAAVPFSPTSGPNTVTSLDGLSRPQLAQLNYVLAKWGQSGDPNLTSAVAMFVWSIADPGIYNGNGGDSYYIARAPSGARPSILANLASMRAEAAAFAVTDPSLALSIEMADQYAGTLTVTANPSHLQGTANLSGAVFSNGATSRVLGAGQFGITGTPDDGAPWYQIGASMSVAAEGYGAELDLYTAGAGEQRIIASVAGAPGTLSASAQTPQIDLDFQPVIGTQVASRYVEEGDAFLDQLAVSVTKGTWTILDGDRIPITATGTLYGPFDQQPVEADSPPIGAPVAGVEELTLAGAGDYSSAGTISAPSSGFYTWVWSIDKDAQGHLGRYLTGGYADRFGQVTETSVVPFQPRAVSTAMQHLVVPGDPLTDQLVVSSTNGPWLKVDGRPIPVVFEGTLYQVPGTRPPAGAGPVATLQSVGASVDPDAVPIGTVTITASGPGNYISPVVTAPAAGFVTWVWDVKKSSQPEWVRDYLAADWSDDYGVPTETTSVRWPIITTSELREYNVHNGGRAFDIVAVTGFPADHGDFHGDGYWLPDVDEVVHTVYGPFADDDVLTDDLDLAVAPVLTSITTPARNGVYRIGFTDEDRITPTEPGYYVIVSSFAGDDRVQPYTSSPADILERFFVPPAHPPVTPPTVITQATPAASVGEPFDDAALVQGTIPDGATLVFRAYGPVPEGEAAVCEEAFYVSDLIAVTQPGVYRSGATSVDQPGSVYWVETLYDANGDVLVEGSCGAPGETTVVTAVPEELAVTTLATPSVELGQPATDTAIVTGTVPDGATLTFEAFRQHGDAPVCTDAELVFASEPIPLERAGDYTSEAVAFEEVGTYYWVETIRDRNDEIIHRGTCGAPGETTAVTAIPVPPVTPPQPPALAFTGMGDWLWPVGIVAGVFLLAGAGALVFGRRLAIHRERNGYVREEDYGGLEDIEGVTVEDTVQR